MTPPRHANPLRDTLVPLALIGGDTVATLAGLILGWWLRYNSSLRRFGIEVPDASLANYLPQVTQI